MDKKDIKSEPVINPDLKKESHGLVYGLLFFLGLLVSLAGLILVFVNIYLGNLVWVIGTGFLVLLTVRNFKNKQGKGFRQGNIVLKIIVLLCSIVLLILINLTKIAMIKDGL